MSYNQIFNQHWNIYQKVLNENYMGHREIYDILRQYLIESVPNNFALLDLGCGDAQLIAETLLDTTIESYLGVDLSQEALKIAEKNLDRLNCEKNLIHNDFEQAVANLLNDRSKGFDIVFAGFALHHLHEPNKRVMARKIYELLSEKGVFILIDVIRQPHETKDDYLNRYLPWLSEYWLSLTPTEFTIVKEHISSSDFPETKGILEQMAQLSGFTRCQCLFEDREHSNVLLVYEKS